MKRYSPKDIEPRWQKKWEDAGIYKASEDSTKPKKFILEYFPYPSGAAMHVGHVRNYTIGDAMARFYRMQGFNVLHPMGWDAFGLPAENYAIKNNISPKQAIAENTAKFKQQLTQMGFSYDWSREINSSDPAYYKWTQWFFTLLLEKGLAYQKESLQWWCDTDKTVLANEQVEASKCWRCGDTVTKKPLKQWFFKITDYADRLVEDLDKLDWSDAIKSMQRNWIGKSKGAEIDFEISDSRSQKITVFTTRPDTIYGATFMVVAPEHEIVNMLTKPEQKQAVDEYIKQTQAKSDVERQETNREKTGVFTGSYAINPATKEQIPIWIADYVLAGYGKGAIMAVPAHDERDMEFAKKFDLDIRTVVVPEISDKEAPLIEGQEIDEREVVDVVVKHPTEDKYLLLKKLNWDIKTCSFVSGGIEPGENKQNAALRELKEETGYSDIKMIKDLKTSYYVSFYHQGKKRNTRAKISSFYVELASLEKEEVNQEELAINEPVWVPMDQVKSMIHGEGSKWIFDVASGATDSLDMTFEGSLINSGEFDGLATSEAREKIVTELEKQGVAKEVTNYKIRDWLISRQRYWGAPIPVVHCEKDGVVAVPKEQLPVELPDVKSYQPTGEGTSVLAGVHDWVNTTCPKCGGPAKRETDTMDGFACSSWYFLRFADPNNAEEPFSKEKAKFWLPVDDYIGGAEHAVMHLLYARMWTKVMFDEGMIDFDEPFSKLRNQGMILAPDGRKMSKSWGNVIAPDEIISQGYGADAIRVMELFIGPWNQSAAWSVEGMGGCFRFLQRLWTLAQEYIEYTGEEKPESPELERIRHKAIKTVSSDMHEMGFNTAIAGLMEAVNDLYKVKAIEGYGARDQWKSVLEDMFRLIAPFAPHMTEELWADFGHVTSIHQEEWPVWDEKYLVSSTMTYAVQVNGKLRSTVEVAADLSKDEIIELCKRDQKVATYLTGELKKTIFVPNKLVNFVV